MVVSSFVTDAVAEVALESDLFLCGKLFVFFVVDDRKGSVIIDVIGGSDGSFIRICGGLINWIIECVDSL